MVAAYRSAKKQDLPKIELIIKKAYNPLTEFLSRKPGAIENTSHKIEKAFQSKNLFVILGEGNKVIGTISIKKINDNTMKLYHFAIEPKFQNQGIGTSILKTLMKEIAISSPEIEKIELEIYEKIQKLTNFYTKLGFDKKGEKLIRGVRIIILYRNLKMS